MPNILIVDDDEGICYILARIARRMGHTVESCRSLAEARTRLDASVFDVVLLDVRLPDGNGLEGLERMAAHPSRPDIVVMTGVGVPADAERAIRQGAWDYLQKGSPAEMAATLEKVLRYRKGRSAAPAPGEVARDGIWGESPQLLRCLEDMRRLACGEGNVLILGETGTGKEAFARALHANSARRNGPFVVVDCAGLPDSLVESLLFGHVRGAFTGAERENPGLISQADGGTLFLDEIGELRLPAQAVLLRVLQQRTFRRVGGTREERGDFRVVAATNRDLDGMIGAGGFRTDLLFRLRGGCLALPPLRAREGDIPLIARRCVAALCEGYGLPPKALAGELLEILSQYSWPGNVRELLNALEYAVNAARAEATLYHIHLPRELLSSVLRARLERETAGRDTGGAGSCAAPSGARERSGTALSGAPLEPAAALPKTSEAAPPEPSLPPLSQLREQRIQEVEHEYIGKLMAAVDGDIGRACAVSGLSQSRLYALLKKYGVSPRGGQR